MEETYFPTMPFPENPSEMTPEWAKDFLRDYDDAYDTLDAQGQFNPKQIHDQLSKRFFGTSVNPDLTLAKFRKIAEGAKTTEASAIVEKVADAAAKAIEPRQTALFESEPSQTTEALRPKTAMEMNYEDFEAAWAMQTAGGARPEFVEFETVKYGVRTNFNFSYVLAKAVMIAPSRSVRIMALRHHLYKNDPDI